MSLSNNVRSFVNKLDVDTEDLVELDFNKFIILDEDEKYIVIAPTYDPPATDPLFDFLEDNNIENCLGVIGSGNINFGNDGYCYTAKNLSRDFNVPNIYNFEYEGFNHDVTFVNEFINEVK